MNKYKMTFETWNKVAALYQEKFMDVDWYNESYDLFCHSLPMPQAKVLEIACGPGNITRYLLSKCPNWAIHAIDVAPNMIELAKKNNPTAHCQGLDARDLHQLSTRYNGIICGFCLPYLSQTDVEKLIKDSQDLLVSKGLWYGSFIAGDYAQSGLETGSTGDQAQVYYYSLQDITKMLKTQGFKLKHSLSHQYAKADGSPQIHWMLIAELENY